MNKQELIERLQDIEWEDFEVKEAKSEIPKNAWETVSAFSNTAGGWQSHYKLKPIFEGDFDYYKITFPLVTTSKTTSKTTDKTTSKNAEHDIVKILETNPHLTLKEVGEQIGLSEEGVRYHIKKLKSTGKVEKVGGPKSGIWVVNSK